MRGHGALFTSLYFVVWTLDTHLEALARVAVAATPDAQGKCVVKREKQRPGHVLTIIREISEWPVSPVLVTSVSCLQVMGD